MTNQDDNIPTVVVTVHITSDHQVANICPLDITCKGPTYIAWNFVGAFPDACEIVFETDKPDFVKLPPTPNPLGPLTYLNLCRNGGAVHYKIGVLGKPLIDPSIDNQPIG